MTVTLHLTPEIEAGLLTHAQARGMTIEDFALSVVEGAVLSPAQTESPEERALTIEEWSRSHPPGPHLSDYAISRESIYEGRGD